LTFLIVGAGPTGVEMAGAIAELARNGMAKDFRNFDPASARILLVQAGRRVLPQFNERLSAFARTSLEALGVEVRVDSRVEGIDVIGDYIPDLVLIVAAIAVPPSGGNQPKAGSSVPRAPAFDFGCRPYFLKNDRNRPRYATLSHSAGRLIARLGGFPSPLPLPNLLLFGIASEPLGVLGADVHPARCPDMRHARFSRGGPPDKVMLPYTHPADTRVGVAQQATLSSNHSISHVGASVIAVLPRCGHRTGRAGAARAPGRPAR
jgi:hypothetical protein